MTNKCWPTCVCQQCWQTKVCRVFKKLANILCWQTMLAVYTLVRFLLANKWQTVRCDWLAVVNIMVAERTDASCTDYTNYTSPFYLCIMHDCTQTDIGRLRFRLRTNHCCRTSSSSAESRHLCHTVVQQNVVVRDTNVGQQLFANKCCPTIVGQHLLVVCLRLKVESQQRNMSGIFLLLVKQLILCS